EVAKKIIKELKENLVGKEVKKGEERKVIKENLRKILLDILSVPKISLEEIIEKAKKENRPALLVFLGFNGVGKSLNLTKTALWLKNKGYKPLIAAGDTFRAAAIDQIEEYAKTVNVPLIKQKYGADSCAVIYDARKAAEARGFDVVLADTAGRSHTNKNLMEELSKICRVNKPDLKILVLDSLSGSDMLNQFNFFDKAVGVDAIIFSKVDVNEKGGNILSVCHSFRKPILFVGVGQNLKDLIEYNPNFFASNLLE
ncbi:MAG: signal recognition particle-docking protein FtsY, partial [Candidatus Aenigmatarchaeota archaeon]